MRRWRATPMILVAFVCGFCASLLPVSSAEAQQPFDEWTDREMEELLLNGDVVDRRNNGRGITGSEIATLDMEPIALWVTLDAGENWEEIASVREFPGVSEVDYPVQAVEPHVRDIVVDAKDRDTMYLNLQVGHIMKTTDGGATWTVLDKEVDADAHMLVSRTDDPSRLYLSTGGHSHRLGTAPGRALYRSEDGGANWSPMAMEFEQEYSIPMVVNPKNEDVVYSAVAYGNPNEWRKRDSGAGASLIRSKDGGATWQALNATPEIACYFPEAITMDPSEPDNVFVATRAGQLFGSDDGGDTWSSLGVQTPEVSDMKAVHV